MKSRFFTHEEIAALTIGLPAQIDVDALMPVERVSISRGCYDLASNFGPLVEEEVGAALEFYSEIYRKKGDSLVRDIFFPTQDGVSASWFEPTDRMVRECVDYLKAKRQTDSNWVTCGSIHGHGRATFIDGGLRFSEKDIMEHMRHFLETQSLATRTIVDEVALPILYNNYSVDRRGDRLVLSDGFAYHPDLELLTLGDQEQCVLLERLGLDTSLLKEHSLTDLVQAYIRFSAEVAENRGEYAVRATQSRVVRHSYFLVFDNEKRDYAEIAILVEDTVAQQYRTYRKQVPIEIVDVANDIIYDETVLRNYIRHAYQQRMDQRKQSITVIPGAFDIDDIMTRIAETQDAQMALVPTQEIRKQEAGGISEHDLVVVFYHSIVKYLDLAHYDDHMYSQLLSDLLSVYAGGKESSISSTLRGIVGKNKTFADSETVFVRPYFDNLRHIIVDSISTSLGASDQECIDFMLDFSYAPHVGEQNNVIARYLPRFLESTNGSR